MPAFTILTDIAQQKLQEAQTTGVAVTLTTFVVGDGGGVEVTPDPSQTALVNQVFNAPLNSLTVDQQTGYLYARGIIPADQGGFTVREIGILDSDGELFAVGKTRNIEKPAVGESDISEVVIDIVTDITNAELVEIQIDPSVVLATLADIDLRGLPPGGLTDYVLKKTSNNDYDVQWFDPAGGLNINVLAVDESVTLADSQTVVTFNTVGTAGIAVYIEGAREFDFTVDSPTQITLDTSYPAGTILHAVQNEPAGTIPAASISFTDTNALFGSATDVQDVIDQLGEASKRAVGTAAGNVQEVGAFGGPTGAQTYWHSGNFTPGDYVAFDEFSAFGYSFIQAADATAGRTLLNLGSAATRSVGTAAGNVMEVGAFGLGKTETVSVINEDGSRQPTGFYAYPSSNSPIPNYSPISLRVNGNAAGRATELLFGGGRMFVRGQPTTDTWDTPVEFATLNTEQSFASTKDFKATTAFTWGAPNDGYAEIVGTRNGRESVFALSTASTGFVLINRDAVTKEVGNRMDFQSNGTAKFHYNVEAANYYPTASDGHLKIKLRPVVINYRQARALQSWVFQWKDHEALPESQWGKIEIGLIAQEVLKVFPPEQYPSLVIKKDDGYYTIDPDKILMMRVFAKVEPRIVTWVKDLKAWIKGRF